MIGNYASYEEAVAGYEERLPNAKLYFQATLKFFGLTPADFSPTYNQS
jgi:hypothetical protein